MKAGFSGILQLTDLNDFIAPSQECIKPILVEKSTSAVKSSKIKIETDGSYVEIDERGAKNRLQQAKITLNDCLACSGCVTSAETVLIQQQSALEFSKALEMKKENSALKIVVSISPQSLASLAVKNALNLEDLTRKLDNFLYDLGVDFVLDTSIGRNFALICAQREFVRKFKEKKSSDPFCLISSACPGWICYAEKTYGDVILPHLSRVRSPQAIMGALVKDNMAEKFGFPLENIYHLTIMPCFDKKLEASRDDFLLPGTSLREVDCVLSTAELDEILSNHNFPDFKPKDERYISRAHRVTPVTRCSGSIISSPVTTHVKKVKMPQKVVSTLKSLYSPEFLRPSDFLTFRDQNGRILSHSGGGSGGYLEHIFRYASRELFGVSLPENEPIPVSLSKNKDFREATLVVDGKSVLKMAYCYGFRNLQNIVQKLRRGKCGYDYVEAMACPGGCLNGGGQIRGGNLDDVSEKYESSTKVWPEKCEITNRIASDWFKSDYECDKARKSLYTDYHVIEKAVIPLAIKW